MGMTFRRIVALTAALGFAAIPGRAQTSERIVAFGDSITFGKGDETNSGGYPPRLAARLSTAAVTVTVENKGLPGETTAAGLSRIGNLSGAAEDSIIIMEGANDLFQDISLETISANLVSLHAKAKARGFGKVYLSTVTPMGATPFGSMFLDSIFLSERIREAHYAGQWLMPDPHQAIYDLDEPFVNYYSFDEFHPNAAGYGEVARIFAEYIQGTDNLAPAFNFGIPRPGGASWPSDTILQVVLFDPLTGVDLTNPTLTINGAPIATTVTGNPQRTVLDAHPGNLLGDIELGVDVQDRAVPPNRRNQRITRFTAVASTFLTGDVNQSGRVDGADLILLAVAFGAKKADKRFDPRVDFDRNGLIDGVDLAQLAANFGRSSS